MSARSEAESTDEPPEEWRSGGLLSQAQTPRSPRPSRDQQVEAMREICRLQREHMIPMESMQAAMKLIVVIVIVIVVVVIVIVVVVIVVIIIVIIIIVIVIAVITQRLEGQGRGRMQGGRDNSRHLR